MPLNRIKCDLTAVRVDVWLILITCLHAEVVTGQAQSSRPGELPETAQLRVQHTGNCYIKDCCCYFSFLPSQSLKGYYLFTAAFHSCLIFFRLYSQFFFRYRRILFVHLTFTLSIFSLRFFFPNFVLLQPLFCLRFSNVFCAFLSRQLQSLVLPSSPLSVVLFLAVLVIQHLQVSFTFGSLSFFHCISSFSSLFLPHSISFELYFS